ncbi:hypothetical protein BT93_A0985 [Corymbia citriodora subsp. variegata]|nr:hypothetical protein BT93_A0985 [Corymbia citriodora subsp. variegata]
MDLRRKAADKLAVASSADSGDRAFPIRGGPRAVCVYFDRTALRRYPSFNTVRWSPMEDLSIVRFPNQPKSSGK